MPARRQRETCPVCGGRKKTNQWSPEGGAHTELLPCLKCKGRGYLLKPLTDAQRLRAVEKDIKRLQRRVKELEETNPRFWNTGPDLHIDLGDQFNILPIEPKKPPVLEPRREMP